VGGIIAKWFIPAARVHAEDAYWDLWEECIKNSSDWMLKQVGINTDNLYWEEPAPTESGSWSMKNQLMIHFWQ